MAKIPLRNRSSFSLCTAILRSLVAYLLFVNSASAAETITIAFVGDANSSAYQGVKQGVIEGNLQGEFLGISYELAQLKDTPAPRAILAVDSEPRIEALLRLAIAPTSIA